MSIGTNCFKSTTGTGILLESISFIIEGNVSISIHSGGVKVEVVNVYTRSVTGILVFPVAKLLIPTERIRLSMAYYSINIYVPVVSAINGSLR